MKKIFKYKITPYLKNEIEMPIGAEVLCVQTQNNEPHIWAMVDFNAELEKRIFWVIPTGNLIEPEASRYVGTFQIDNGNLVFHLFEN